MTQDELIEAAARAIYEAECPLSGDTISVTIHNTEHVPPEGTIPEQLDQVMDVCRSAARAALAVFETEWVAPDRAQARLISQSNPDQSAQIKLLREALEPFAEYAGKDGFGLDNHGQQVPASEGPGWVYVTIGDFRRARAAWLAATEGDVG